MKEKMKKNIILAVIFITFIILLVIFAGNRKINKQEYNENKTEKEMINITKLKNITLITVYDNYQSNPVLQTGHGFSCLIKTNNKTLLFDTGANSETLLGNMEKLNIDINKIDTVILSHEHYDHIGGMSGFLEKNNKVEIYIPKSFLQSFKEEFKATSASVVDVYNPAEISSSVYSTGELETNIGIKEQSLIIATEKGLVIITGCSHPGIVNIVEKAKDLTGESIYFVLGGFHLSGASDFRLRGIINDFRRLGVEKVAPCHCSGDRCRELFEEEYSNDFIANGIGKIVEI